ncbi:MAG: hypothetical protein Q7R65_01825 [bacterium]|nr:hypothetical protein [bacterium]
MTTESADKRFTKIYLSLWGICIFVGLVSIIFYKFGYRVTNQLEPVKVGSIELSANEEGVQIFLNNREQKVPFENNRYVLRNITPGLHSIVVSKDGFWPWAKTIAVAQNNVRKLYAFLLPMDGVPIKPVASKTPEYVSALKVIEQSLLPEPKPESPELLPDESLASWLASYVPSQKLSADKSTALYVENNTVYVAWVSDNEPLPHYFCLDNPCKFKIPVVVPNDSIKSVDFYKGRQDTVIFAAGTTIYVIDVDREGTQNFQPLYKGNDPYFYQNDKGVLYIKDGNSIFSASL